MISRSQCDDIRSFETLKQKERGRRGGEEEEEKEKKKRKNSTQPNKKWIHINTHLYINKEEEEECYIRERNETVCVCVYVIKIIRFKIDEIVDVGERVGGLNRTMDAILTIPCACSRKSFDFHLIQPSAGLSRRQFSLFFFTFPSFPPPPTFFLLFCFHLPFAGIRFIRLPGFVSISFRDGRIRL